MIQSRLPRGTVAAGLVLVLIASLLGGCIFDTGLEATVLGDTVFISTNSSTRICNPNEKDPSSFECKFFSDDGGRIVPQGTRGSIVNGCGSSSVMSANAGCSGFSK